MIEEDEEKEPDPEKIKEFMFEAISAMGPRLFRPNQEAHISYGMTQQQEEAPLWPLLIIAASTFIAGAIIGAIWGRRLFR
jgi:hypothetical protein